MRVLALALLFSGDGGVFGALDLLGFETTGSAEVTEEPLVTCTVRGLATALNRVELGCARAVSMSWNGLELKRQCQSAPV
jgi:hypothetical protein